MVISEAGRQPQRKDTDAYRAPDWGNDAWEQDMTIRPSQVFRITEEGIDKLEISLGRVRGTGGTVPMIPGVSRQE